jgi:hypothetical protein
LAPEEHSVTWDVALGYFTGLRLFAPHIDAATLVRTVFVVHTCDAIMCRLIAHNNGYPKRLWTGLGFCFGVWAVAVLMVLPRRGNSATRQPAANP